MCDDSRKSCYMFKPQRGDGKPSVRADINMAIDEGLFLKVYKI